MNFNNIRRTQNSDFESYSLADGLPSSVENGTLPPVNGEISENSEVQNALVSCSPRRM